MDRAHQPRDGHLSRRRFLGATGGLLAGLAVGGAEASVAAGRVGAVAVPGAVPFYGIHQAGVTTPQQRHTEFVVFDVHANDRSELAGLLRSWTEAAADLTRGSAPDRLTVNVGFGPGLFGLGGADRFGLADRRPVALVGLPSFAGDAIDPGATGGDLTVQVCADDRAAVVRAVDELVAGADGAASVRWARTGSTGVGPGGGAPRDPLGFRDGIVNPRGAEQLARFVWAGAGQDQPWMAGGTYLVVRRIRIDLDRWRAMSVTEQERAVGRHKRTGRPLGGGRPQDPPDLTARTAEGEPAVPADAHVRLASPRDNWGQMILRRSYSYRDGDETGLLFCCYQVNPRLGFTPMYARLSTGDALRHVTVHTASAVAALPPGAPGPGRWLGDELLAR